MPDNGDIRSLSGLRQGLLDGDNNSCLSICGRLPAPDALLRLRDERVDGRRELVLGKEARRRSVVFAEIRDDALAAEPKPVSQNLRGIALFAFADCENVAHPSHPRAGCDYVHAGSAALVERPIGNRDTRIDRDIRMGDEENRGHRTLPLSPAPAPAPRYRSTTVLCRRHSLRR